MALPRIAIIIVTYNSSKFVRQLVNDVNRLVYPRERLKVIFVDNNSLDDTVSVINEMARNLGLSNLIRIVKLRKNLGLPAALAVGIYYAVKYFKPHILLVANPDIRILDNTILLKILKVFKSNSSVCMVSPVLVHLKDPSRIQWALGLLDIIGTAYTALYDVSLEKVKPILGNIIPSPWNTFAFIAIRSDTILKLGLPRIDFFLYYEDVEYSLRALKKGCINVVLLEPAVAHYEGGSSEGNNGFLRRLYFVRNSLIVTFEYLGMIPFGLRLLSYVFLALFKKDKAALYGIIKALIKLMRSRNIQQLNSRYPIKHYLIHRNSVFNYFLKCLDLQRSLRIFSLLGFVEYFNLVIKKTLRCKAFS